MSENVVSREYSIAAAEILDLLTYWPIDMVSKVPRKLLEFFAEVADPNYELQIDCSYGLDKVNITDKTRALLAMIYRNYLCTNEEREEFDLKLQENEEVYQQEIREKYNPDELFKKEEEELHTELVIQEEKWYQKIWKKFLRLCKK